MEINIDVILYKGVDDSIEIIDEFIFDLEYNKTILSEVLDYLLKKGYNISGLKLSQWNHVVTEIGYLFYMNLENDHNRSNEVTINRMSKLKSIINEI